MRLHLRYLTTGYCQHVFTSDVMVGDGWVFKIPAAFGYILPFKQPFNVFHPKNRYERILRFLLVRIPKGVPSRVGRWMSRYDLSVPGAAAFKVVTKRCFGVLEKAGERAVAWHCRRTRLRKFLVMLRHIRYIGDHALGDILLPCRVLWRAKATLDLGGQVMPYEGPLLVQKRVDSSFEDGVRLTAFDWHRLVEAQHRLWRHGIGFAAIREMLTPIGWGLLDGRLHLADTSALTRDLGLARRFLAKEFVDSKEATILEWMGLEQSTQTEQYLRFMRSEINVDNLERLWGKDIGVGRRQAL
jgi:hypothetical protein